ncbi:putative permease [Salmonella enterica subsp. arizonae]|nr:putative permease [Salmonella enterica subsp. arizonae]
MLRGMDSDKIMLFTTTLMTGVSGAMASIVLLVMTVVFMLFEVRHVPYKLRFALNNPQNPYCRSTPRPERRLALFGPKKRCSVCGRARLSGWGWR